MDDDGWTITKNDWFIINIYDGQINCLFDSSSKSRSK